MAVNINDLDLTPESVPEIDWEAPESGSFPPQIWPGIHEFAFALAEDGDGPFGVAEIQGQKCLEVTFSAITENDQHDEVALNFQRATTFLNQAMRAAHLNHKVGELIRSLGMKIEGPMTKEKIGDALNEASAARQHFHAEVEWRRYCKSCETTVSTHPRKKKGAVAWPRDADKRPELIVACPTCGDKGYGEARITRFKLPDSGVAATVVHSSANGQGQDISVIPF
jgi:RNase P subunit RPR2